MGPSQRIQVLLWNPPLPGSASPKGSCERSWTLPAITAPSKRLQPRQHESGSQVLCLPGCHKTGESQEDHKALFT